MFAEGNRVRAWLLLGAVLALATLASAQSAPALPPAPIQPRVKTACTECHDAGILVQQRLSKATWTKEVDKMIRWGAVVDAKEREAVIDYLSQFSPDKPPYQPPAPHRVNTKR